MTFPAIINATGSIYSGLIAFIAGILVAWKGFDLFKVAVTCCSIVFIIELIII
jgi:hypothetical protein